MNELVTVNSATALDLTAEIQKVHLTAFAQAYCGEQPRPETLRLIDGLLEKSEAARRQLDATRTPASDEVIGVYLSMLLKAVPSAGKGDAEVFGRYLYEDIVAARPSIGALDAGCRTVRRTCKFLPTISEVMDGIENAESSLRIATSQLDRLPAARAEIEKALTERSSGRSGVVVKLRGGE